MASISNPKASKVKFLLVFLTALTLTVSCSNNEENSSNNTVEVQQPLNPNGDSELALLMRDMYDEAERVKTQIDNGEKVTINLNQERILTAHATEPEKAASPEYKAFAQSYLQSLKSLQEANEDQVADQFDNLVANCMMCHQSLCPGPMVKIKKLK